MSISALNSGPAAALALSLPRENEATERKPDAQEGAEAAVRKLSLAEGLGNRIDIKV